MSKYGRICRVLVAGIAICCLIVLLLPGHAKAIESGGIGGRPAKPRDDNARSQSIFVHSLKAGQSVTDEIQVVNNTDEPKVIVLYPVDSLVSSGGTFACAQRADERREVGNWIIVEKDEVRLASATNQNVGFTISVPAGTPAGEYNGCIALEESNAQPISQGNGIILNLRSAIRVVITVPGDIKKGLFFTSLSAVQTGDKLKVNTALRNNGNVSLDTDLEISVKTGLGTLSKQVGGTFPVLKNQENSLNFEVDKPFWGGFYTVQAKATYNSDPAKSIGQDGRLETVFSQRKFIWISPRPLAIVLETAIIGLLSFPFVWTIYRRRKVHRLKTKSSLYYVNRGDSLHSIAKAKHLNWKDIVLVNKLKAPYHIEPGRKLHLPSQKSPARPLRRSRK